MFEQLFEKAAVIASYRTAPYAEDHEHFLEHLAAHGYAKETLRQIAWILRHIARESNVSQADILAASRHYAAHAPSAKYRKLIVNTARRWLQFLGRFEAPIVNSSPFDAVIEDFSIWMERERGLSPASIESRRWQTASFLNWLGHTGKSLTSVSLADVDAFQAACAAKGLSRWSIRNRLNGTRCFLRYAGSRNWCSPSLAQGIEGPPIYAEEDIALGPSWDDIERLISSLDTKDPRDIRDRAIIMLFAIYGLRASEVTHIRLQDLDWDHDQIVITRSKLRQAQRYPLVSAVGHAIVRYLKEVRPQCQYRELFVTMQAPRELVTHACLYGIVLRHTRRLGIHFPHHRGPHALRHACAGHLLTKGLTLKEIGDHLGHRSAKSTRIYAKVDLIGLREVASFDLGGVL
jgi:integrase/recombinase XerD